MQKQMIFIITLLPLAFTIQADSRQPDLNKLKSEAVTIVKKFGSSLKPQLKQAMQQGGPVHAIEVCSEKAPEIARELSRETGWQIKRVSLKPRNHKTAAADAWERDVLKRFDRLQAEGESADTMAFAEISNGNFRFMKAQGVEAICLNCHGTELNPEVEQAIKQHYPQDSATGYRAGQIRGAFSLSRQL